MGLVVLAFTAVIREGLETALFLVGQATSADSVAASVLLGALVGLAIAVLIGAGFYRGARLINLRTFFRWTGIALIFIAAGLLSSAVHEFVEIGAIAFGTQHGVRHLCDPAARGDRGRAGRASRSSQASSSGRCSATPPRRR